MKMVKLLSSSGCAGCKALENKIINLIQLNNYNVHVEKVTDIAEVIRYGVMSVPALVIDEDIKCFGRVPSEKELNEWLN